MPGDVVTVASGKGGVGKTTTAVNLGVALRQRGHSVVVLDADLGMPNVAGLFDIDHDATLHDVLAADTDVDEAVLELAEGLAVLGGDVDLERFADAEPDRLEGVVETLAERYRYVLVDTGGGLTYEGVLPLELGDETLLVTSPDPAAVGDTEKSGQLADRVDVPVRGVVVTHATDDADPEAVAERVGAPLLGVVPLERAVSESTADGTPVAAYAPESGAAEAYDRLAARLADDDEATLDPLQSATRSPGEAPDDADAADEGAAGTDDATAADESGDDAEATATTDGGPAADDAADADDGDEASAAGADDAEPGEAGDGAAADDADDESTTSGGSGGFFSRLAGIFR